jgi:hypothetical protein
MTVAAAEHAPATLNAYVDVQLKLQLEQLARRNERTVSAEVRLALRRHLSEPARPSFEAREAQ